jgi:hypothetical protein
MFLTSKHAGNFLKNVLQNIFSKQEYFHNIILYICKLKLDFLSIEEQLKEDSTGICYNLYKHIIQCDY